MDNEMELNGKKVIYADNAATTSVSPAVLDERKTIMAALSAAWIFLMSEDKALIDAHKGAILEMLNGIPYEELYYVPFFYAINVISELSRYM